MKIESDLIEFIHQGSDSGEVYEVQCPECKGTVRVVQCAWWDTTCDCGYKWSVNLIATGEK